MPKLVVEKVPLIYENPSKNAVTVAASGKELEADVQRKMKVWGVIEAFRNGYVFSYAV